MLKETVETVDGSTVYRAEIEVDGKTISQWHHDSAEKCLNRLRYRLRTQHNIEATF
jgi:hypothetical protein